MPTGERTDPFRSFNFKVEIEGLSASAFSECSGLTAEGDPVEYREGTDKPLTPRKLIGLRKYANIVLKRGYTNDEALWEWYKDIVNGKTHRKNGIITLMDEEGTEVMRWTVENAWPNKIEGPTFNASGNEVAMESLELCHEGLMLEMQANGETIPMLSYQTPGVYYERVDASAPRIAALRTDIAGFAAIAIRGPIDTPVPTQSWRQFLSHFGGFTGSGYLAYAVRAFFENGGQRCWVVRVAAGPGGAHALVASSTVDTTSGAEGIRIAASSPGVWGEALAVELREVRQAQTLTLAPQASTTRSLVASTGGFERHALVRLRQTSGAVPIEGVRIVSQVDHENRTLIWVSEDENQLDTDATIDGFDLGAPIEIEAIDYTAIVREDGRVVETHAGLSLAPGHERYVGTILGPVYDDPRAESAAL